MAASVRVLDWSWQQKMTGTETRDTCIERRTSRTQARVHRKNQQLDDRATGIQGQLTAKVYGPAKYEFSAASVVPRPCVVQ